MTNSSEPAALTEGAAVLAQPFNPEAWAAATAGPGDWFDSFAADRVCAFFPRYLRHTKGRWAGQPFELEAWQRQTLRAAFGWKKADGSRRFRIVYVEIPRKNGKTSLAAGVALYLAFADGEPGAEVYCAATDKNQARICFDEAKKMRSRSPWMLANTNAQKDNVARPDLFWQKLEVISAEEGSKHGLNVHGLVGDEIHEWKGRGLYDVLHTATGARQQPLEFLITTAGSAPESFCGETHDHALKVRDGILEDREFLPVLFAADADDDITAPATWAKANPSLGRTVAVDWMAKEAQKAIDQPSYRNTFKRLHLNIWTEQETLWLPPEHWKACALDPCALDIANFAGRKCYGALDLSTTTDLTALALLFPRPDPDDPVRFDLWAHFWLPAADIDKRVRRDRVPYDVWARDGFLTLTEGNVVDYDVIRRRITGVLPAGAEPDLVAAAKAAALVNQVEIVELAHDRWNSVQLVTQLQNDMGESWPIRFGQGYAEMSPAAKEFERLVMGHALNHGGNPVLRWMASCVSVAQDPAGNIKPVKPDRRKSTKRIDGIVAGIMTVGRASLPPAESESFWQRLGVPKAPIAAAAE